MDADDVMKANRLEVLYGYMKSNPTIDIAGSDMDYIGEKLSVDCDDTYVTGVSLEDLATGNCIANPTVIMRTSSIRKHGLHYDKNYKYAEDYNFWVDALIDGLKIVNMPQHLILYRKSDSQISSKHQEEQYLKATQVQNKINRHLYEYSFDNSKETEDNIQNILTSTNGNKLTVVIPFLNEKEEVVNTLHSIRSTVGDNVEIIVINDNSDNNFNYREAVAKYRASYIENKKRMGVAWSRDLGVSLCRTPYFLLLDAHMRFYDSAWNRRIVGLLEHDDRVLLCCQSRFLGYDEQGNVVHCKNCHDGFGAVSMFKRNSYWPDIEWNLQEHQPGLDIEPIAHVLGAGYAASCRYWNYIKGLEGLRKYGCDEAFISFKVWREGGRCLLVKDVVIGHIYRSKAPYRQFMAEEISNYMLVSRLTFSQSWHCLASAIGLHKDRELYTKAVGILRAYQEDIDSLGKYLSSIYTRSFEDVLQIHRDCLCMPDSHKANEGRFREIGNMVKAQKTSNHGLYNGRAGQLIWHCQYNRWNGKEADSDETQQLWKSISDAIDNRLLPWNFSQGLAGIGWGIMYLYTRGFIDEYPLQLLHNIDKQLEEVSLERVASTKIDIGIGGILAYAVLRTTTGKPSWNAPFAEELKQAAARAVTSAKSDLPTTYYAMFFLDILRHGVSTESYIPRISEWNQTEIQLTKNPKYWKVSLYDGCTGAVMGIIDNDNNKKQRNGL